MKRSLRIIPLFALTALSLGLAACGSSRPTAAATAADSPGSTLASGATAKPKACLGSGVPEPTGKFSVGTTMIDNDIRVFFPAEKSAKATRPPYVSAQESAVMQLSPSANGLLTPAAVDARPITGTPRPVVLIGPGGGFPVVTLTGLGTELASQGYVVAMVDTNYIGEATGEGYSADDPDGPSRDRIQGNLRALDLIKTPSITAKIGPVDMTRIAAGGHSAGGSNAFNLALQDQRIKAVFDLDGNLYDEATTKTVTVPALGVITGPSRDLTSNTELKPGPLGSVFTSNPKAVAVYVPAGAHFSVTDAPFLIDFLSDVPDAIGRNTRCVGGETTTVVTRFLNSVLSKKGGKETPPTATQLTKGLTEITANP
jgi:dienelactone hydrolase